MGAEGLGAGGGGGLGTIWCPHGLGDSAACASAVFAAAARDGAQRSASPQAASSGRRFWGGCLGAAQSRGLCVQPPPVHPRVPQRCPVSPRGVHGGGSRSPSTPRAGIRVSGGSGDPRGGHGASTLPGAFPCTVWLPSAFTCAFPHVLLAGSRGGECARSFPCRSRCRGCRGAAGLCLGFPWKPRCSDVLRAAEGLQKGKSALSTPLPRALHPVQFPTRSQKALWLFPLANLFIFNTLFQEGMGCQLAKCLRISLDSLEHFFINNFSKQLKGVELSKQKGRWPGTGAP